MQKTNVINNQSNNEIKIGYDLHDGLIVGTILIHAPVKQVFQSLASESITDWWVRPGVFDVTSWTGDVQVGGHWKVKGTARNEPYTLQGDFLEIQEPTKLKHSYGIGNPWGPTFVTYKLEAIEKDTRLTLRHEGFKIPSVCEGNGLGWETCFQALKNKLEK